MKKLLFIGIVLIIGFSSCERPPEFPDNPIISLNNFEFKRSNDDLFDSLNIFLDFQDGDGDLGLAGDEVFPPYEIYNPILNNNGDTIRFGDSEGLPDLNCEDYELLVQTIETPDTTFTKRDTIFVERNPDHFNFFLEFWVKRNGEFELFNFSTNENWPNNCTNGFNGRFPILNEGLRDRPLEGTLKYGVRSTFLLQFRNDTLKLRARIQDRALNKSNWVETEEFLIDQIIK